MAPQYRTQSAVIIAILVLEVSLGAIDVASERVETPEEGRRDD
jgi:hypothetical protein